MLYLYVRKIHFSHGKQIVNYDKSLRESSRSLYL